MNAEPLPTSPQDGVSPGGTISISSWRPSLYYPARRRLRRGPGPPVQEVEARSSRGMSWLSSASTCSSSVILEATDSPDVISGRRQSQPHNLQAYAQTSWPAQHELPAPHGLRNPHGLPGANDLRGSDMACPCGAACEDASSGARESCEACVTRSVRLCPAAAPAVGTRIPSAG